MILTVFTDSKRLSQCQSCGALITFAELLSGKTMPFNGRAVGKEHASLLQSPRDVEDIDTTKYPSHFATCPQARHHRRGRPERR